MPSASLRLFATFTKQQRTTIKDPQSELYLIWEVEYESPKGKKRKYGEINRVTRGATMNIESWNENE
jgi:hypothetical protein